jgi:DNA processing protein
MATSLHEIVQLNSSRIPESLREIPEPPERLYTIGELPPPETKLLTIVGSRKYTPYGQRVCEKLVQELRGYPVSIVSGLALGIDAIAHEAALRAGLHTIAVPGSGLSESVLYPRTNVALARRIVDAGGTLLSEFSPDESAARWTFPKRNRIMAGLADATLVVEATERSGTLITARLALEYNKSVLSVPASIFDASSSGSNNLLVRGATPITSGKDILDVLNILPFESPTHTYDDCTQLEAGILRTLDQPRTRTELLAMLSTPIHELNTALTTLEIKGYVKESAGKLYAL